MINPFTEVDYLAEARTRYTQQFKNKDLFDRYVQLLLGAAQELQDVFKDLKQLRSLDTAVGKQLDQLGAIVGQDRVSIPSTAINYFGFSGATGAQSFGDLGNTSTGGLFYNIGDSTGNVLISDNLYRLFIKARILANSTNATPEAVIHSIKFLLNSDFGFITEQPNAHLTLNFGAPLSSVEQYVVKGIGTGKSLIPIPVGVAVDYIGYVGGKFFGFSGVAGAQGFGDLNAIAALGGYGEAYGLSYGVVEPDTVSGGIFASLI